MATPSTRSDGQRREGYHYSKCLGAFQQEDRGKLTKEVQSRDAGGGSLAENCYSTENFVVDRRVIANLEKELQAAFNFVDGKGSRTMRSRLIKFYWVG